MAPPSKWTASSVWTTCYKLETQYGQSNQGAKDVLRRISHCVESAGVDNVKASLSAEDKTFLETGLVKYLRDHGRDTKIVDDPQLKALAELGGREQHQTRSRTSHAHGAQSLLKERSEGSEVAALQRSLAGLGYTDAQERSLHPDGNFGAGTKAAVEKFQRAYHLTPDGVAGPKTLDVLQKAVRPPQPSLADTTHPGSEMYLQALDAVYRLDAQHGHVPDQRSHNLAGSLAAAAHHNGLTRVDHVLLSEDANRAFAVQGDLNSPLKRFTDVHVVQAIDTPIAQSSAQWHDIQQLAPAPMAPSMQQTQNPQVDQPVMQR